MAMQCMCTHIRSQLLCHHSQIGKRLEILEAGLQELAETAKPATGSGYGAGECWFKARAAQL